MIQATGNSMMGAAHRRRDAFTLIEVVTALMILALMTSSVLVVVKRCMVEAADSRLKLQALEVAREKMEEILAGPSVKEGADFGQSDRYPNITWQTTVENFTEPVSQRMWVRVTSGAEYVDANDATRQVELTHWITSVTKDQLKKILEKEQALTEMAGASADGSDAGAPTDGMDAGQPGDTSLNPDGTTATPKPKPEPRRTPKPNYPWGNREPTMEELMEYIRSQLGGG